MMLSKSCEYAIRAIIYIAASSTEGRKVGIPQICSEIGAPEHFTAKILQLLSKDGLISSQKGINGGFFMTKAQGDNRLTAVVSAIDGDQLFTGCGLGLKRCSEEQPCPIHHRFRAVRESLRELMEEKTIEELACSLKSGAGFLKSGYGQ